jgi:hypothetical protein
MQLIFCISIIRRYHATQMVQPQVCVTAVPTRDLVGDGKKYLILQAQDCSVIATPGDIAETVGWQGIMICKEPLNIWSIINIAKGLSMFREIYTQQNMPNWKLIMQNVAHDWIANFK